MLSESESERWREERVCKERMHVLIPYVNHVGIGGMRQLEWIKQTHKHTHTDAEFIQNTEWDQYMLGGK